MEENRKRCCVGTGSNVGSGSTNTQDGCGATTRALLLLIASSKLVQILKLTKLELINHMIQSKLLTIFQMAPVDDCSTQSIIHIRSNLHVFANVRAPGIALDAHGVSLRSCRKPFDANGGSRLIPIIDGSFFCEMTLENM